MSVSFRIGFGGAFLVMVAVLLWVRTTLDIQLQAFQTLSSSFAVAPIRSTYQSTTLPAPSPMWSGPYAPQAPTVVVIPQAEPPSLALARTHAALRQPIDLPFPSETPLSEVIRYIRLSTCSPEMPDGLPVYLDPTGFLEAEQTADSLDAIDLNQIPVDQGLDLILRQLGLRQVVLKSGVVAVTYHANHDLDDLAAALGPTTDLETLHSAIGNLQNRLSEYEDSDPKWGR